MEITQAQYVSLKQLHEQLRECGVRIAYTQLSAAIGTDKAVGLLQIKGTRARREIPQEAVDVLARFIPVFRRNRIPWEMFDAALEQWLTTGFSAYHVDVERLAYIAGLAQSDSVFTDEEAAAFLRVTVEQLRGDLSSRFPPVGRLGDSEQGDRWLRSVLLRAISSESSRGGK